MKKSGILLFCLMVAGSAFAQPAKLTSAFNANKDGKYEEAMTYIEEAASDPKVTSKEKYWRYRGDIYFNIAKDATLSAQRQMSLSWLRISVTSSISLIVPSFLTQDSAMISVATSKNR